MELTIVIRWGCKRKPKAMKAIVVLITTSVAKMMVGCITAKLHRQCVQVALIADGHDAFENVFKIPISNIANPKRRIFVEAQI